MRRTSVVVLLALALAACGDGLGGARHPRTTLQLRDAATGAVSWSVQLRAEADATEPLLAGEVVIVADPAGEATGYSVKDGRPTWHVPGALPEAVSPGIVVFDYDDRVDGRRSADGKLLWRRAGHEDVVRSRAGGAVLLVDDGRAVAERVDCGSPVPCVAVDPAAQRRPATVTLVDAMSGRGRWKTVIPEGASAYGAGVSSHHAFLELPDHAGLMSLSLTSGRRGWTYRTDYLAGVTTSGDLVAVGSGLDEVKQEVRAADSGSVLWTAQGGDPFLDGLGPFVGSSGHKAFLRDPQTGQELPGRVPFTYDAMRHGDLLVGATATTLTALRAGRVLWTSELERGARPITYLDASDRHVASVTATGQERTRD